MSKEEVNFSWVQTHKEIVEYLSTKRNAQVELIELLKAVGITGFHDEDPKGHRIELKEIDPFTFFCYIYKYGSVKRLELLQKIAKKLKISIPTDELGIPSANAQKVCLFPFKYSRNSNEIDRLWSFFVSARNDSLTDDQFSDILTIKSTGLTKLTEALFNIIPEKYFPINRQSKPFLGGKFGINPKFKSYSEYLEILKQLKEKSEKPFYKLSYDAWYENQGNRTDSDFLKAEKQVIRRFKAIKRPSLINDYLDIVKDIFQILKPSGIDDPVIALTIPKGNKRIALTVSGRYIAQLEGKKTPEFGFIVGNAVKVSEWISVKSQRPFKSGFKGEEVPDYTRIFIDSKIVLPDQVKSFLLEEAKKEYGYQYDSGLGDLKNTALYQSVVDLAYRQKILQGAFPGYINNEEEVKYYLLGASWNDEDQTEQFVKKGNWLNGYKDKFLEDVNEIEKGDKVAIKSTYTRNRTNSVMLIKARGIVKKNIKNGVELIVDWEKKFKSFEVDFSGGYWKTVHHLTNPFHIKEIFDVSTKLKSLPKIFDNPNIILYGPPGTGKTYNTINYALGIVESNEVSFYETKDSSIRKTYISRYNQYKNEGQIEFITFHQNYSYEDFVQGIKPDVKANQLSFERLDGIFKEVCTNALFEYYLLNKQDQKRQSPKSVDFEELYISFIEYLKSLGDIEKEFKSFTGTTLKVKNISANDNLAFSHKNSARSYVVSGVRLKKLYRHFPKISDIKNVVTDIRNTIGGCNATAYWTALNEILKFKKNFISEDQLLSNEENEDYSYEDKIRLLKSTDFDEIKRFIKNDVKRYVLIIDEINRANISRVFGELITLLEKDKRFGALNEIIAILPSKEEFVVPPNVYVIGTMNTADKSIALLDIALRRRFSFKPFYPRPDLIKDSELREIFKKLNEQIKKEKNIDFTIGHSYFMDKTINDLEVIMNDQVLPLLVEYFMNELDEVKSILKTAGVEVDDSLGYLKYNSIK